MIFENNKEYWFVQWFGLSSTTHFALMKATGIDEKTVMIGDMGYECIENSSTFLKFQPKLPKFEGYYFDIPSYCFAVFSEKKQALEFLRKTALSEIESTRAKIIAKLDLIRNEP